MTSSGSTVPVALMAAVRSPRVTFSVVKFAAGSLEQAYNKYKNNGTERCKRQVAVCGTRQFHGHDLFGSVPEGEMSRAYCSMKNECCIV